MVTMGAEVVYAKLHTHNQGWPELYICTVSMVVPCQKHRI